MEVRASGHLRAEVGDERFLRFGVHALLAVKLGAKHGDTRHEDGVSPAVVVGRCLYFLARIENVYYSFITFRELVSSDSLKGRTVDL